MIDHLSIGVRDLERAMPFYDATLGALGHMRLQLIDAVDGHPFRSVVYGPPGSDPDVNSASAPFWLEERPDARPAGAGTHLCFTAATRRAVAAFHKEGLAAGGTDNGAPGLRPHYGANYYAAFLLDPDGNQVEAVTFSLA